MQHPRLLSSILSLLILLSASQAGPTTQPSGSSSRIPITKRLGVDFVRATWCTSSTSSRRFSKTVGPNAPLYSSSSGSENVMLSAEGAVDAWTKAGFPLEQIVLGVPAYGHGFNVPREVAFLPNGQLAMNTTFTSDAANRVVGDSWDSPSAPGGTFSFLGARERDTLAEGGRHGRERDHTPYIYYDNATQVMVSYDNAASLEAKGRWIMEKRLAFEMFEAAGDYHDILMDGINKGLEVDIDGT